jgi:hypothetical protein
MEPGSQGGGEVVEHCPSTGSLLGEAGLMPPKNLQNQKAKAPASRTVCALPWGSRSRPARIWAGKAKL